MTIFYNRYCELCAKANKSVSGVASAIGLSNAAANGWKKGKIPSDTTLAKLSDYFGVSVEWLKGETEQKEKSPAPESAELTPDHIRAIEKIKNMPPEELAKKMAALEAVLDM